MARKRAPSVKQYAKSLEDFDFNWYMHAEMESCGEVPAKIIKAHEKIEDDLIEHSLLSRTHTELYEAYLAYAIDKGPKPLLVEVGKENGKMVYSIKHDNVDGLIFDWRKQHVRI
tara:strand:- start:746 stop:1087 length:342 start_codon:yes stop_codon:yes gene_type:complete